MSIGDSEKEIAMQSEFTQTDVIVVGAGLAGLATASYLARAGVDVTLFEKSANVGGRATTQNYDGYYFNRGIHSLYCGGALEAVLRELGISYSSGKARDVFVLNQGKLYPFPASLATLLSTGFLDVSDKLEMARLFATLPRLKPHELANVSIREWLPQALKRPRVRQFIETYACTVVYSSALDLVSAEVLVKKLQLLLKHPVLYIDGGWQTLVDGLRSAAEQAGAHIVSGARVESIVYQDGYAQGVRLRDGRTIHASAVVIATPPQDAVKLLDDGAYQPLRQIADSLIPARVACLDVALSRLPDARYPIVQDMEHPRFMAVQSVYARVAPSGGALIHVFKQLDPTQPTDPREDERELEDMLDAVQPGWRDVLVRRIYLPHIEAIGALPTASSSGYAGRPGPRVPGIANLYLAGDWIGEGFLADASMGSAREVAQQLLRERSTSMAKKETVGSVR
jgi:phytoene dehydrogenase-like protein